MTKKVSFGKRWGVYASERRNLIGNPQWVKEGGCRAEEGEDCVEIRNRCKMGSVSLLK